MLCNGLGECPERQMGRTVNPLAYAFVGSSPTSPTSLRAFGASARQASAYEGCRAVVAKRRRRAGASVRAFGASARQASLREGCRAVVAKRRRRATFRAFGASARQASLREGWRRAA